MKYDLNYLKLLSKMYSNHVLVPFEKYQDSTSTPKRRRLGTRRILRSKNHVVHINGSDEFTSTCSPITCETPVSSQRSESPYYLPCNQVEYLCDSNNSSSSQIACSPDVLACSFIKDEKWESFLVSTNAIDKLCNQDVSKMDTLAEFDEMSHDMFNSKLEISSAQNVDGRSKFEQSIKENIEHSFSMINQSICQLAENHKTCDKSSLFETKDSFLLDIKESEMMDQSRINCSKEINIEKEGFYGLPMITKGLFKSLRNIETFYDWQEECLNLEAIKRRQNLIYALPTSGGKTLVAEVLMLREVLLRKKNALFILPFVAIVQEKIWALSPFAVQLDFLVEEYAAGKGHIPPKKRRKKNSIYIATIEKGLALVRSLIELNRLDEIGLIVVDELHLIGEKGRGGTLETLLTTIFYANPNIQVVGMSATIGNLCELGEYVGGVVFTRHFRPVELTERVKLGDMLHNIRWTDGVLEVEPHSQLSYDYSESAKRLDPDGLAALVWSGKEPSSCLVFCPTKKNCENVASLLCQLQPSHLQAFNAQERSTLERALRGEGAAPELYRGVRHGVAFHHAGLGPDERHAIEHAFRAGVLTVLCCTSTLAAGVNLPAARVLIRAPYVGREFITLAAYRQMVGRAGRAGLCDTGTSTVICSARDWTRLRSVLQGGVAAARSVLGTGGLAALLLSGAALRLATTRPALHRLAQRTLLAVPQKDCTDPQVDIKAACDAALLALLRTGALEAVPDSKVADENTDVDASRLAVQGTTINNNTQLSVSKLAMAAIKGCMDLSTAKQLLQDVEVASRSLVLMGSLHLLFLVTPHDGAGIRLDYRHYYSLYCSLDDEGVQTAKILGITEMNAIRMVTGKSITNVSERVLVRFYLALMLHDLWKQVPLPAVADKYLVGRGLVQSVLTSSCAFAASAHKVCSEVSALWALAALLGELALRLQHCAAPHLAALLQLPHVRKTRALQLVKAGYKRVEELARARADDLVSAIPHLSLSAAEHLICAARMMLIEKVENLRAEAEDVMDELKV